MQWKLAAPGELFGEFLRWEIATAAMGAVLEIDPFDEPNVSESKDKTRALIAGGPLPQEEPALRSQGLALFASAAHAQSLRKAAGALGASAASSVPGWIAAHLSLANPSDYISLQVYMPQDPEVEKNLNTVQGGIRNATRLACTLGFGPRFLHSTGQLHKGGANNGVFLQITSSGGEDLPIPGLPYSFGTLFAAQARGDLGGAAGPRPPRAARPQRGRRRGQGGADAAGRGQAARARIGAAMQLAMLGLGKMGGNMVQRLLKGGHRVIAYDVDPRRATELAALGAAPATTLDEVFAALQPPRVCWSMVPAGRITEELVHSLAVRMSRGDVIVDGGNSNFKDSMRRAKELFDRGIHFCDAGTSGGVWGLENGYCLMVGGAKEAYATIQPVIADAGARRTADAHSGPPGSRPLHQDGPQRHRVRHACRRTPRASRSSRRPPSATWTCPQIAGIWQPRQRGALLAPRARRATRSRRTRTSRVCAATSRTPARDAGRCRRRSTRTSPRR